MSDPYRSATPPAERTSASFACFYCGGGIDQERGVCTACNAPVARREVVTALATGCPRCHLPLEAIVVEDARVFRCDRCHGVFVGHVAWEHMVGAVRETRAVDLTPFVPPPPSQSPAETALHPLVPCPACLHPMDRFTFGARSKTVADVCDAHGLWLDGAELAAVLSFVRRLWDAGGMIPMTAEELAELRIERDAAVERIATGERDLRAQLAEVLELSRRYRR